ncbi:MAG: hypothetical protein WCR54_04395 [Clostridia bacterium]
MENMANQVSQLLKNLSFLPNTALQLAFAGTVILIILFLFALLLTLGSKMKSLTKKVFLVSKMIASEERIDENNVDILNQQFKSLPEEVNSGWSRFLEQRIGYPSDYMKEKNVLDESAYQANNKVGHTFFRIFGFLAFALVAFFAVICCAEDVTTLGLKDFVDNFTIIGGVISAVVFPILFYIIFNVILGGIYRKQRKHLILVYKSFQDNLDEKVVISASEEEEFVSDNLEDITKNIEEIIASRLNNKDIVEVITTPKVDEAEYVDLEENKVEDYIDPTEKELDEFAVTATKTPIEKISDKESLVEEVVEVNEAQEEIKELPKEESKVQVIEQNKVALIEEKTVAPIEEKIVKSEEKIVKIEEVVPVTQNEVVNQPQIEEEVAATAEPLSKEEQASYLAVLYDIVDEAIADVKTEREDLEQIAELIFVNLDKFEEPNDKEVLEGCLYKLADLDTIIANRKNSN